VNLKMVDRIVTLEAQGIMRPPPVTGTEAKPAIEAKKAKVAKVEGKVKAAKMELGSLIATAAYARIFKTGSTGWFGRVVDTTTGIEYQIIGAVQLGTRTMPKAVK
jgi:hypothetical protein